MLSGVCAGDGDGKPSSTRPARWGAIGAVDILAPHPVCLGSPSPNPTPSTYCVYGTEKTQTYRAGRSTRSRSSVPSGARLRRRRSWPTLARSVALTSPSRLAVAVCEQRLETFDLDERVRGHGFRVEARGFCITACGLRIKASGFCVEACGLCITACDFRVDARDLCRDASNVRGFLAREQQLPSIRGLREA